MRTIVTVSFDGRDTPAGEESILEAAGCDESEVRINEVLKRRWVRVALHEDDARLNSLRSALASHGIEWSERVDDIYARAELLAAHLNLVIPNREYEVDGGPEFGTTYDLSQGCPRCGTGAPQTSPLIVSGEEVVGLRDLIAAQTFYRHIIVRENVARDLVAAEVTGVELRKVFESCGHTQRKLPFNQICAQRTMPPMSPRTTGLIRENVCSACRRNGYFQTTASPTRPVYRAEDIRGAQDVNATWECFGYSILKPDVRDSVIAQPLLVISPKVLKIFMDHGITAFDYYPIRIDDGA